MRKFFLTIVVLAVTGVVWAAPSALELTAQTGEAKKAFQLKGKHARQQLVATAAEAGKEVDVTRSAKYSANPANVVAISSKGLVTPLGDGEATITAATGGLKSEVKVKVCQNKRLS